MKIAVSFNFGVEEKQLETKSTTVRDLLSELSNSYGVMILANDHREVSSEYIVLLNGQWYKSLTDGIDTKLNDGDKVVIYGFFIMAGG